MRILWHFIKSNVLYNKLELSISYCLMLLVFTLFFKFGHFLGGDLAKSSDSLISVAFYALLYAFYSNKKKLNIKYLLSLPLSKAQLLFTKSISDLIFFMPAMLLAYVGIYRMKLEVSPFLLFICLLLGLMIVSLVMFDSDIEQPRLENTRASFANRLIYLRKAINFAFLLFIGIYVFAALFYSPGGNDFKEIMVTLLLVLVFVLKFNASLRLLRDESLSYFILKRDLKTIGLKFGVLSMPIVLVGLLNVSIINISPVGDNAIFTMIEKNNIKELRLALKDKDYKEFKNDNGLRPIHIALTQNNKEVFDLFIENGHVVDYAKDIKDERYQGLSEAHLAIESKNLEIFKEVMDMRSFSFDQLDFNNSKSLLIHTAKNCSDEIADYLIAQGAQLNLQDKDKKTALMHSLENSCHSISMMLLHAHADQTIVDKNGKTVYDYIPKDDSMKYFFEKKLESLPNHRSEKVNRGIASEQN